MESLEYYDKKAKEFFNRTINRDMSSNRGRFLRYLSPKVCLLDAGCGCGRDTKAFLEEGYKVTAFDASEELVKISKEVTRQEALQLRFQDINFENEFEGIWANASLLHVPYHEFKDVLLRLHRALKPSGILYSSFKKGDQHRQVEERHFFDHDEKTLTPHIVGLFDLVECWNSEDAGRAANTTKQWFNVILRKKM